MKIFTLPVHYTDCCTQLQKPLIDMLDIAKYTTRQRLTDEQLDNVREIDVLSKQLLNSIQLLLKNTQS